jgi:hypothetical protein
MVGSWRCRASAYRTRWPEETPLTIPAHRLLRILDGLLGAPGARRPCVSYSHRNTFADAAVHNTKNTPRAATSPTWLPHPAPLQIPRRSDTA